MIKKLLFLLTISLILTSCGSSKRSLQSKHVKNRTTVSTRTKTSSKKKSTTKRVSSTTTKKKPTTTKRVSSTTVKKKASSIIKYAKSFNGTRYKLGGTTKKGMDCSGLIYTSFKKENVVLPRTSRSMSTKGKKISLSKVVPGDLLFFKTNNRKNVINHVGLVISIKGKISFIHASSSRGVMISGLNERYWKNSFASARRIL